MIIITLEPSSRVLESQSERETILPDKATATPFPGSSSSLASSPRVLELTSLSLLFIVIFILLPIFVEMMDRAEEMSYRTVVSEPRNVIYLDTYAWILFVKGKFAEARIYMNRAVDPQLTDDKLLENELLNGNVLEHAGDIHACCDDLELAMRFWQLAVARNDGTCSKRITTKIKKRKYLR